MSLNKLLFALGFIAFTACGTSKQMEDTKIEPGESEISTNGDEDVIWVNSSKGDCSGIPAFQTQEGTEKPDGNWDCFYQVIESFNYEPGHIYQIAVERLMIEGKPGIKAVRIISKERDIKYFKIYDIWAATHLNGEVLDVSATRPNMEINLNTMKMMGKGMCNQYFGAIELYNETQISFGPIAGTKMMCPEISVERSFLAALAETERYEIKEKTLHFYNKNKVEVMRFQKVD